MTSRAPFRCDALWSGWCAAPLRLVHALNGVSVSIARGETLAVVGESGCGKSTLARALVRLIELDAGQIDFAGANVRTLRGAALRLYNRRCNWSSRTRTARSIRA